jgi:hypothetical protein
MVDVDIVGPPSFVSDFGCEVVSDEPLAKLI